MTQSSLLGCCRARSLGLIKPIFFPQLMVYEAPVWFKLCNCCLLNITDNLRVNCSSTTGERLALSVASHSFVRLALAYLKGREVSAAGGAPRGGGVQKKIGGSDVGSVGGWVMGSISKNRPSHHKSKSPKEIL